MSEWWSYRPSDFLMFAPRTYWRLFELHNEAWWPAQPVLLLAALAWLAWLLRRRHPTALRAGIVALAAAWAITGASFLLARYAPINWAASGFALGFGLQAAGLAALATRRIQVTSTPTRLRAAMLLGVWAVLGHPLLAPAFGRPWVQAEVLGLAPDPTAIATLALLLWTEPPATRAARALLRTLWVLPLAWCAIQRRHARDDGLGAGLGDAGGAARRHRRRGQASTYSLTDPVIPDT
jgi:hypothetical protein